MTLPAEVIAPASEPATEQPAITTTAATVLVAEESVRRKPVKTARPKKARPDDLFDFFAAPSGEEGGNGAKGAMSFGPAFEEPAAPGTEDNSGSGEDQPADAAEKPSRVPRAGPVNPALLRKAVNQIMPLFAGEDPGAGDCLKDNRATFRTAFTAEAYTEFEEAVKAGDFPTAIEHLRKAARRHGILV